MIRYVVRKLAAKPLTSLAIALIVRFVPRMCAGYLSSNRPVPLAPNPVRRSPLEKRNNSPAGPSSFFRLCKTAEFCTKMHNRPPADSGAGILTAPGPSPTTRRLAGSPVQKSGSVHSPAQTKSPRFYRTSRVTPTNYNRLSKIDFVSQTRESESRLVQPGRDAHRVRFFSPIPSLGIGVHPCSSVAHKATPASRPAADRAKTHGQPMPRILAGPVRFFDCARTLDFCPGPHKEPSRTPPPRTPTGFVPYTAPKRSIAALMYHELTQINPQAPTIRAHPCPRPPRIAYYSRLSS